MEEKRIEAVNAWPEPQSIWDILVFLGFTNFYRRFIKGFCKIVALFTSMLKIMAPSVLARPVCPKNDKNELGMDSNNGINVGRINNRLANLLSFMKKMSFRLDFLTSKASLAFI